MKIALYAIALPVLLAGAPALANVSPCVSRIDAQPRCKKGCPCGNSCISCSKTCRISSSPPPATPTAKAPVPAPPATLPTTTPSARRLLGDTAAADLSWVGSSTNRLFFLSTCPLVPHLPSADRVDVRDSMALSKMGFRRLLVPGC